jgi:hypothetical protein
MKAVARRRLRDLYHQQVGEKEHLFLQCGALGEIAAKVECLQPHCRACALYYGPKR